MKNGGKHFKDYFEDISQHDILFFLSSRKAHDCESVW